MYSYPLSVYIYLTNLTLHAVISIGYVTAVQPRASSRDDAVRRRATSLPYQQCDPFQ